MKIAFFTEYGSNYNDIAGETVPVMRRYCEKHGYDFHQLLLQGTGNEYYYQKHIYIRRLFNDGYDWVFYLDVDALVMNHDIDLFREFIGGTYCSLIITNHVELNGGAIIMGNSYAGRCVNDFILHCRDLFPNEQNVINYFKDCPLFSDNMKVVDHPAFNSLDYSQYPEFPDRRKSEEGHWNEGDFILHFPGLGTEKRLQLIKEYKQKYGL